MTDEQPVLVVADNYQLATIWAVEHSVRAWQYIQDLQTAQGRPGPGSVVRLVSRHSSPWIRDRRQASYEALVRNGFTAMESPS